LHFGLDKLLSKLKLFFFFFTKQPYLNKEVNCTEPSPSARVPCLGGCLGSAWVFWGAEYISPLGVPA
jgi:hypothetical protein